MKKLLILFLLFSTMLFGAIGKITVSTGDVTISRAGKTIKAISNTPIEEKDSVISKASSSAQLLFSDGTAISIGANTNFKVQEFLYEEGNSNKANAKFGVSEGAFKAITGKIGKVNPDKFKLETKTATIGIRGTRFLGMVPRQGPETIACTQGKIAVTPLPVPVVSAPAPGATPQPAPGGAPAPKADTTGTTPTPAAEPTGPGAPAPTPGGTTPTTPGAAPAPTAPVAPPATVEVGAGQMTTVSIGKVEAPRAYTPAEIKKLESASAAPAKKADADPASQPGGGGATKSADSGGGDSGGATPGASTTGDTKTADSTTPTQPATTPESAPAPLVDVAPTPVAPIAPVIDTGAIADSVASVQDTVNNVANTVNEAQKTEELVQTTTPPPQTTTPAPNESPVVAPAPTDTRYYSGVTTGYYWSTSTVQTRTDFSDISGKLSYGTNTPTCTSGYACLESVLTNYYSYRDVNQAMPWNGPEIVGGLLSAQVISSSQINTNTITVNNGSYIPAVDDKLLIVGNLYTVASSEYDVNTGYYTVALTTNLLTAVGTDDTVYYTKTFENSMQGFPGGETYSSVIKNAITASDGATGYEIYDNKRETYFKVLKNIDVNTPYVSFNFEGVPTTATQVSALSGSVFEYTTPLLSGICDTQTSYYTKFYSANVSILQVRNEGLGFVPVLYGTTALSGSGFQISTPNYQNSGSFYGSEAQALTIKSFNQSSYTDPMTQTTTVTVSPETTKYIVAYKNPTPVSTTTQTGTSNIEGHGIAVSVPMNMPSGSGTGIPDYTVTPINYDITGVVNRDLGTVQMSFTDSDTQTNTKTFGDTTDTTKSSYISDNHFVAAGDSNSGNGYVLSHSENDDYVSWGYWAFRQDSGMGDAVPYFSTWVAGVKTNVQALVDIANSANATYTYNGGLMGVVAVTGTPYMIDSSSTISLKVNFGQAGGIPNGTISEGALSIKYNNGAGLQTWNVANGTTTAFVGGYNSSANFTAGASGDNNVALKGSFYGPAANAVAGTFKASNVTDSTYAIGVFKAKR